jgi:hypothetical protein
MARVTIGAVLLVLLAAQVAAAQDAVVTLSCSGKFFGPEVSSVESSTSGSVIVDFDKRTVTGLLSGNITEADQYTIKFAWSYPSKKSDHAPIYRSGQIDRITGQAWQSDTRNKSLPITTFTDYTVINVVCRPVKPQF